VRGVAEVKKRVSMGYHGVIRSRDDGLGLECFQRRKRRAFCGHGRGDSNLEVHVHNWNEFCSVGQDYKPAMIIPDNPSRHTERKVFTPIAPARRPYGRGTPKSLTGTAFDF
jgi:hypothetical protein